MEEKKLRELALFAEIAGGIAVVVSLVFLILETRENTNAIHAQTYQSLTSELNVWRALQDSDLTDIELKFDESGIDSLSDNERRRYFNSVQSLWGIYESAFYARERGVLGDSEWSRFRNQLCRRKLGGDKEVWVRPGREISSNITETFKAYVEGTCRPQ